MGSIYKRGNIYWIKYYRNGKPYRESTKSKKEADAKRLLKKREGEIAQGKLPGIYFDRIRFEELAEDFLSDYRINRKKSIVRAQRSVNHLLRAFKGMSVVEITTPRIRAYIEKRLSSMCKNCRKHFEPHDECPYCGSDNLKAGAANATVNRELAALKRMLNLGAQQTPPKVDRTPYIPMLRENNVRKGFFEHVDFVAFRDSLPSYLKPFVTFAYKIGWRYKEIADLTWKQVDRQNGIVRLESGETKNNEGRTVYLDEELKALFEEQYQAVRKRGKIIPYVFPNKDGTDKIRDFRSPWNTACRKTGLGYGYKASRKYVQKWKNELPAGPILHDLRRTAIRNMIRSGTPERVAMMISGHKTRSVFDRYNIVSDSDLKLAAQNQEIYLNSQTGTKPGTIVNFGEKEEVDRNG